MVQMHYFHIQMHLFLDLWSFCALIDVSSFLQLTIGEDLLYSSKRDHGVRDEQ